MSQINTLAPDVLIFVPNPTYGEEKPIGMWRNEGTTIGDLSGGYVEWNVAPAGAEAVKYLWNIEDYSVILESPIADYYVTFEYITGEPVQAAGNVLKFAWTHLTGHSGATAIDSSYHARSYNHYICQPKAPYTFAFNSHIININALRYYFSSWGYLWLPTARRLAGGPVRP